MDTWLWNDPWVKGHFLSELIGPEAQFALGKGSFCKVSEVIHNNAYKRFSSRRLACLNCLQSLPPPATGKDQILFNGKCTIKFKDVWNSVRKKSDVKSWSKWLWKSKVPRRIGLHAWKCFNGGLPTHDSLQHKGIQLASRCCLCCQDPETAEHLLFQCSFAKNLWMLTWIFTPSEISDLSKVQRFSF